MNSLTDILKRASISNRAEVRDGEALFWHPLAQSYAALPATAAVDVQVLSGHGWQASGDIPKARSTLHQWASSQGHPVFLASTEAAFAHVLVQNGEQDFSLLTFTDDSDAVHRRDSFSISELLQPQPDWTDHDWDSYPALLKSERLGAGAFWALPATANKRAQRKYLADTLTENFWHGRLAQDGLKSLVGEALVGLRAKFIDSPKSAWLDQTARLLNLELDSRRNIDLATDMWMLEQASDQNLSESVIPAIRSAHGQAFESWPDDRIIALLRSGVGPLSRQILGTSRKLKPAFTRNQVTPMDAVSMRGVLVKHYGEPVISALVNAGKLHLLTTGSELPLSVKMLPNEHLIAGVNIGGDQVFMVADRISASDVPGLFLHEVGEHSALPVMLGPDYGRMSAHFQRLLRKGDSYATWAAMKVPTSTAPQNIASERLAYLVERVANDSAARPGGDEGYALGQQCLTNIRTWLFRTPLCRWLDDIAALDDFTLSPSDMASMAREAVNSMVSDMDPSLASESNPWNDLLDQQMLDLLFSQTGAERQQTLASLPSEQLVGYLYALATANAPEILENIEAHASTLHHMSTGLHGEHLSAIAGEVLAVGYARESQKRTADQLDRNGFGMWMEFTADPEKAQLKLLTTGPDEGGAWDLTHYSADVGAFHTEKFLTAAEAIQLIGPLAFPVSDLEAPQALSKWSSANQTRKATNDALAEWSKGTQAADDSGKPLVFYHGTGESFTEFSGFTHWVSSKPELASEYAFFREGNTGQPNVMPVYVKATKPFDADVMPSKSLTVAVFFNEAARQAKAAGRIIDIEEGSRLLNHIRSCSHREESGPYYSAHQFWNVPSMLFGSDGADSIKELFQLMGFDSIKYTESDTLTYGVFNPQQIKSALSNTGLFDPENPDIRFSFAGVSATNACLKALSDARARHAVGEDVETIWQATGWHFGHDAKWRFEIDDSQAAVRENWNLWGQNKSASTHRLCDLIDHPALFDAYNHLRYMKVTIDPEMTQANGMFDRFESQIYLYGERTEGLLTLSTGQMSSLFHELAHAIQDIERFGPGGSPLDETLPASRAILEKVNARFGQLQADAEQSDAYRQVYEARLASVPEAERYREGRSGLYDYGAVLAREAAYAAVIQPIETQRKTDVTSLLATFGALEGLDNRNLAYRLISGEVEARNVQARLRLTASERRTNHPLSTEDVPASYVIAWHDREVTVAASSNGAGTVQGAQFSFVGQLSNEGLMDDFAYAREQLLAGEDAEKIRQNTGWFLGHDRKWRYEVDDSKASLINVPTTESWAVFYNHRFKAYSQETFGRYVGPSAMTTKQFRAYREWESTCEAEYNARNKTHRRLDELLVHPALFLAYPKLGITRVEFDPSVGDGGSYSPNQNTMKLGVYASAEDMLSVVMHETQHVVQAIEDFSSGGDPARLRDIDIATPRIREINLEIHELLNSNAEFGNIQRQVNRDFIKIQDAHGDKTATGIKLDWDTVPDDVRTKYFALLDALEPFAEQAIYWNLVAERTRLHRDQPVLSAFEQYKRLAGEVEARNVQRRQSMTAEERVALPPSSTEDIRSDAIIVVNGRDLTLDTVSMKSMRQTQLPTFKSWFEGSALVDESGQPLMLFHGTDRDLDRGEFRTGAGTFGEAIYLTGNPARAGFFARLAAKRNGGDPLLMPVYASLKNPWVLETSDDRPVTGIDTRYLAANGYDGIIVKKGNRADMDSSELFEVAVFSPEQIKSAISNLGPHDSMKPELQYRVQPQTETHAFTRWFGSSQVTDSQGAPKVMYHGTVGEFSSFDPESVNARFPFSFGFHFTSRPFEASIYADSITNGAVNFDPAAMFGKPPAEGGNVMPVYLRAQRPLVIKTKQTPSIEADQNRHQILEQLATAQREGQPYDSVIIRREEGDEWDGDNVIVFSPNQVKSAIGNVGSFELGNPDIRFRQLRQTETPEFQNWFGRSGVVDEMGEPLVVYHGTVSDFSSFDAQSHRSVLNQEYQGDGFHFSPDPAIASQYANASRNHFFNKAQIYAVVDSVMPSSVASIFKSITEIGYSPAWDSLSESMTKQTLADSDAAGIDINDLLDLIPFVEGNRYDAGRDSSWNTMDAIQSFFNSSYDVMDDATRDMAVKLGLESALPNQSVMPVYLKAERILFTTDPQAAKRAQEEGYDGVHYSGPGTVGDVPEFIVFRPEQIKSAIGNGGAFSSATADIRFSLLDQTDTPEFKAWFDQSRIVHDDGKPVTVYHGTEVDFTAFDPEKIGSTTDRLNQPTGAFWFAGHPRVAEKFATSNGAIMPMYLSMQNPLVVDCEAWARKAQTLDVAFRMADGRTVYDIRWFKLDAIAQAKRDGHDGVVFEGGYDDLPFDSVIYAAFKPAQMKSAIGNIGSFDASHPDIRFKVSEPFSAARAGNVMPNAVNDQHGFAGYQQLSHPVDRAGLASALFAVDRLARSSFDGREFNPSTIMQLLSEGNHPALQSFLRTNFNRLVEGEDVTAVIRQHVHEREAQIASLEQHVAGDDNRGAIDRAENELRLRHLRGELGWLAQNSGKFSYQKTGKAPVILDLDRELPEQPESVKAALKLLGFETFVRGNATHEPTGLGIFEFAVSHHGGEPQAAKILSEAGIDGISYASNQDGNTGGSAIKYRVFPSRKAMANQGSQMLGRNGTITERISEITDVPGMRVSGPLGDVRNVLIESAAVLKAAAQERLTTFEARSAWLGKSPATHKVLLEKNAQAITSAHQEFTALSHWKAPGANNTLPWNRPIPTYLNSKVEALLGKPVTSAITGQELFNELVQAMGSQTGAVERCMSAGVIGVHADDSTVIWDGMSCALADGIGRLDSIPRFHLAYHGTPHTVEKFSASNIGTGEGAQAYGHGLYFAQLKSVATHYQSQHTRKAHWLEGCHFKNIEDLAQVVVPEVVALHPELSIPERGTNYLESVLNRVLSVKAYGPQRLQDVLSQLDEDVLPVAQQMLSRIRPVSEREITDFFIHPSTGARGLNEIDVHDDSDFRFGQHYLESGLHWKLREGMSSAELQKVFEEHLQERTDVLSHLKEVQTIREACSREPGSDYWESRLRDAEFSLALSQQALKTVAEFGPFTISKPLGNGNLYMVDINIQPGEYLQYDRPFSEQAGTVKTALNDLHASGRLDSTTAAALARAITDDRYGSEIYNSLSAPPSSSTVNTPSGRGEIASAALLSFGIKGIRYKDGDSRSGKGESYNFVVFDDALIRIVDPESKASKVHIDSEETRGHLQALTMSM